MLSSWLKLSSDLFFANLDAQRVISLRLAKIAKGGRAAEAESRLMVTEKLNAATEAAIALACGKTPHSVVKRYRTIMRSNTRRLTRK